MDPALSDVIETNSDSDMTLDATLLATLLGSTERLTAVIFPVLASDLKQPL